MTRVQMKDIEIKIKISQGIFALDYKKKQQPENPFFLFFVKRGR